MSEIQEAVVFVASPADCADERKEVRSVAEAFNNVLGNQTGMRIRVSGWEHVQPDYGRPQERINPLVDECDVFIGILNRRLGSATGTHESGFVEEFERAAARRRKSQEPRIAIFFKTVPRAFLEDPGPELQRVLDFKQRVQDNWTLFYKTFESADDLASQLWPILVQNIEITARESSSQASAPSTQSNDPQQENKDLATDPARMDAARRQIAETTESVFLHARGEGGPAIDGDRLLLVALGLNPDGGYVRPHVANRLYRRRSELSLSVMEADLWIRSLVSDVGRVSPQHRSIPGCALVLNAPESGEDVASRLIPLLDTTDGDIISGVFQLLLQTDAKPEELWQSSRAEQWHSALQESTSSTSILRYLYAKCDESDQELLDRIYRGVDDENVADVIDVIRGKPNAIISRLAEARYADAWQVEIAASSVKFADDQVLQKALIGDHTPTDLRNKAFHELLHRGLLDKEAVGELLSDGRMVREIFEAATGDYEGLNLSEVASALNDVEFDSSKHSEVRHRLLASLSSFEDLIKGLDDPELSLSTWHALSWRTEPEAVSIARTVFDRGGGDVLGSLANQDDWKKDSSLDEFVRRKVRLGALRILLRQEPVDDRDIERARLEAERPGLLKDDAVALFASVAKEEHIDLLVASLGDVYGDVHAMLVERILELGGIDAARNLLTTGDESEQAKAAARLASEELTDVEEVLELLYSSSAAVRIAALRGYSSRADQQALESVLEEYAERRDTYYYNVVCWLDAAVHLQSHG